MAELPANKNLKTRLHEVIFESDTREGKNFDVTLLILIITSVLVVIIESIPLVHDQYYTAFRTLEWFFTVLFTVEYLLRIYAVKRPVAYMLSFYGIVDLLAILPTYLSLILPGSQYLLIVRALRLLRVFRIFKLAPLLHGQEIITRAVKASIPKILVFLTSIIVSVTIIGALMYVVESPVNPSFSSIPNGIYWAVTTMTTVGFGDITPITNLGRFLSTIVMLLGYSILAVPTGIISAELVKPSIHLNSQVCSKCGYSRHDDDAKYCKRCGTELHSNI